MKTYGERIKEARKAKHMTQEELGELIGVTGVTIMRYEKGQREPRMDQLQKIGDVLGINWTYLVGCSIIAGDTLEEAAAVYDDAQRSRILEKGIELVLESIYGKPREVTIEGKWFNDTMTVYGEGDDAFVLGADADYALLEAIPALVKSLVKTLSAPAARQEEATRQFLSSKEAKAFYDEAAAQDKARIQAMMEQKKAEAGHEE